MPKSIQAGDLIVIYVQKKTSRFLSFQTKNEWTNRFTTQASHKSNSFPVNLETNEKISLLKSYSPFVLSVFFESTFAHIDILLFGTILTKFLKPSSILKFLKVRSFCFPYSSVITPCSYSLPFVENIYFIYPFNRWFSTYDWIAMDIWNFYSWNDFKKRLF